MKFSSIHVVATILVSSTTCFALINPTLSAMTIPAATTATTYLNRHMVAAVNDDISLRSSLDQSAEFPPPLTSIEKVQRAATFWSVAIPIVANYYGLIGNLKLQEVLGSPLNEEDVEVRTFTFSEFWMKN